MEGRRFSMEIKRGDIWMVDLGSPNGNIQGLTRPCVVTSNDLCNRYSPVLTVAPISSKGGKLPTHVVIGSDQGLLKESVVLCEQVQPVNRNNLKNKISRCDKTTMVEIEKALQIQLGIQPSSDIGLKKIIYLMQNILEINNYLSNNINKASTYKMQLDMYENELKKCCEELNINLSAFNGIGTSYKGVVV